MNNLYLLCKELYSCYHYTKTRMTDDYYFNHGSDLQRKFFNYLHDQVEFGAFFKKLEDHQDTIQKESDLFFLNIWNKYKVRIDTISEGTRILEKKFFLSDPLREELNKIIEPIDTSCRRLGQVINPFTKIDSPSLIGSNWKLRKIFSNWKHTKGTNDRFVLQPDVVDEIINNYFLYLKFGGS